MADLSRRGFLVAAGAGVLRAAGARPRLTAADISGRGEDALKVAILGTAQDAKGRENIVKEFNQVHPDIPVQVQGIQGADWSQFFAKVLTLVAAGTPPDVCYVATEGVQLFADKLGEPLDRYVQRDKAAMQNYFSDVHASLIEAAMYEGSLSQTPNDLTAPNIYYTPSPSQRAGLERPPDDWTKDASQQPLRQMKQPARGQFRAFF